MKQYVKPETESFQTTSSSTLCASTTGTPVGVELGTMNVKSFTPMLALALMLSGLLMLPSCKNGNEDINQPVPAFKKGEVVTITTAPLGSTGRVPKKVHIGSEADNNAQLVWTESDKLRVIVPNGSPFPSSDFDLTDGEKTKVGTFTGTMPADGSEFFLAYPCGNVSGGSYTSGVFRFQGVSVPNVQDFTVGATSFNPELMPVVGYGTKVNDVLKGQTTVVGGALRVKLTNKTGSEITFNKIKLYVHDAQVSESGEKTSVWSSGYTVDYYVNTRTVTLSGTTAGNSNIVLNLSKDVTLEAGATSGDFYFVMVAPLYFESTTAGGTTTPTSFTVSLYDYDGVVTKTEDLNSQTPVATTSFNYNIFIEPGDIAQGTLEMTKE